VREHWQQPPDADRHERFDEPTQTLRLHLGLLMRAWRSAELLEVIRLSESKMGFSDLPPNTESVAQTR
jgi:hypothetical protein